MSEIKEEKYAESNSKCRNFCLTIFNHPQFTSLPPCFTYLVSGEEICPETQRPHLQVYGEVKNPLARKTIQKHLQSPGAHIDPRSGTAKQASDYCKKGTQSKLEWKELREKGPNWGKDAKFIEFGTISSPEGVHSAWLELHAKIKTGQLTINDIIMDHPMAYHKYGRVLTETHRIYNQSLARNFAPNVTWIHGPTGSGKSRYVYDKYGYDNKIHKYHYYGQNDSYRYQDVILLEEFHGQLKYNELLELLDRYPMFLPARYSSYSMVSHYIYVCSSDRPDQVYKNIWEEKNYGAELLRRINCIITTDPEELHYMYNVDSLSLEPFERCKRECIVLED